MKVTISDGSIYQFFTMIAESKEDKVFLKRFRDQFNEKINIEEDKLSKRKNPELTVLVPY